MLNQSWLGRLGLSPSFKLMRFITSRLECIPISVRFTSCAMDVQSDPSFSLLETMLTVPQLLLKVAMASHCGIRTLRLLCKAARSFPLEAVRKVGFTLGPQRLKNEPLLHVAAFLQHNGLHSLRVDVQLGACVLMLMYWIYASRATQLGLFTDQSHLCLWSFQQAWLWAERACDTYKFLFGANACSIQRSEHLVIDLRNNHECPSLKMDNGVSGRFDIMHGCRKCFLAAGHGT